MVIVLCSSAYATELVDVHEKMQRKNYKVAEQNRIKEARINCLQYVNCIRIKGDNTAVLTNDNILLLVDGVNVGISRGSFIKLSGKKVNIGGSKYKLLKLIDASK